MPRSEPSWQTALIGVGSNLAFEDLTPRHIVRAAVAALGDVGNVAARSGWWTSPAWPDPSQPPYINGVVRLRTPATAVDLLASLRAIETRFGRERRERWASRTLDLDIIDYGGVVEETEDVVLPHQRAHERAFVLLPLRDVAPGWRHPASGEGVERLIAVLEPQLLAGARRYAAHSVAM